MTCDFHGLVTGTEPESRKTYKTRTPSRRQFSNRLDSSPKNNDSSLTQESITLVKGIEKFFLVLKQRTHHKEITLNKLHNKN
jgi:hypothetical protein